MKLPYQLLIAATLGCTLAPFAQAAPDGASGKSAKEAHAGRSTPGQLFKEADANKDGKVSLEELHAIRPQFPAKRFQHMDRNGDGFLEERELPAPGRGGDGKFFARMDSNKDDKISLAEFKKHAPKMDEKRFAALDKNGDGFVQRKEFPQRPSDRLEHARGARNRPDSGAYLARLIEKHDTNGNKELSLAELQSAKPGFPESTFAALDRDKNGVLDSNDAVAPQRMGRVEGRLGREDGKRRRDGLRKADTNKDGKISFEEAQAAFPNMKREGFDRRDRNGDGFLSPEDRKAR
ncbi:MAG: EF-hand domain-containing protein [Candidatus Hydrogenedentes bacterium]|nr:EF-hand domain-containing protein [Candidatus Hydrogenedentota bacterium]